MAEGLFGTAATAGVGAAAGYAAYRFIPNKSIAEAKKYIKAPELIELSIKQSLGDNWKSLSKIEVDQFVKEGVEQNKQFLKKTKNKYIAIGAAGLTVLGILTNAFSRKNKENA